MKSLVYKIVHVKSDCSTIPVCEITGLANSCFLISRLYHFLPDDEYLVLLSSDSKKLYRAYSSSGSLSPSYSKGLSCLAAFA